MCGPHDPPHKDFFRSPRVHNARSHLTLSCACDAVRSNPIRSSRAWARVFCTWVSMMARVKPSACARAKACAISARLCRVSRGSLGIFVGQLFCLLVNHFARYARIFKCRIAVSKTSALLLAMFGSGRHTLGDSIRLLSSWPIANSRILVPLAITYLTAR